MNYQYIPPEYLLEAFHCPHCNTYAVQRWMPSGILSGRGGTREQINVKNIALSICTRCSEAAVWLEDQESLEPATWIFKGSGYIPQDQEISLMPTKGRLIYPSSSPAPMPADDMPEDIKKDYLEAREIVNVSPRGAAALLRLCVQKLMPMLGGKGKDINADIGDLVKRGLSSQVQQALDSVRVIGNEAVHPGTIDLNDDKKLALALFEILNFIVEQMITQSKKINSIYNNLPQSKLDSIDRRDKR